MVPVKSSLLPTVSRFLDDDWNNIFDWTSRNFSSNATTLPAVNVKENEDGYIVEMAAPGMKKTDFQIELLNNVLTIKSESHNESQESKGEQFTRREFSYRSFQRSFNLNEKVVDDGKIKATYTDGILRLELPKKDEAKPKPARTITIK